MKMCLAGTYSVGQQKACTVCPAGSECDGTSVTACPANKWSNEGEGICKFFEGGFSGFQVT